MNAGAVAALVVGLVGTVYTTLWVANFRGWTSRVLAAFYRIAGSFLWPGGKESGYVAFMRFMGVFGVMGFLAIFAIGIKDLVAA